MNARFWVWHIDGFVKLTLRPAQRLSIYRRGPTDEGWAESSMVWEHRGDGVSLEWRDAGRDCDGYTFCEGESFCPLAQLRANTAQDVPLPAWAKAAGTECYDEYAEAAGY